MIIFQYSYQDYIDKTALLGVFMGKKTIKD